MFLINRVNRIQTFKDAFLKKIANFTKSLQTKGTEKKQLGLILSKKKINNSTVFVKQAVATTNCDKKLDYSKVAVFLRDYSDDFLEQYKSKLKQLGKTIIEISPGKNTKAIEQAFLRLKKQGIRLVTICDSQLIGGSLRKLSHFNIKVKKFLDKNNLIYVHPDNILGNSLINAGVITKCLPNEENLRNIALGVYTLNDLINSENGKSIVVQSDKVLGIESEVENTLDLIDRCIDLKITRKGGIVFKTTKLYQRETLNFPVIDVKTVLSIHDAKLSGIAVNAKYCRIENMSKVVKIANRKNVFIIGI